MSTIHIRLATVDEIPIIIHHRSAMFAEMGRGTEQSRTEMETSCQPWLQDQMANGRYLAWFACDADAVVAGAGLWLQDWLATYDATTIRPYVLNVYTEPSHRRQGIAGKLLNSIIDYCRDEGHPRVILHASVAGRTLYESLDFVESNEMFLSL